MAMTPRRGAARAVGAALVLAMIACSLAGADEGDLPLLPLTREVTALGQQLERLIAPDDLVDSLYFGWSDEPYGRATLACAMKTARILEREISLRRTGGAALRDTQVRQMLEWLRVVPTRAQNGPRRGGFFPHRQVVRPDPSSSGPAPALFTLVDRSTMTRLDDWYADADLLAACGFKVIARADRPYLSPEAWRSLINHAEALRLVVVRVGDALDLDRDTLPPACVRCLHPRTLREWMGGEARTAESTLIDPPHGETWGESIARRGLYRGVMGGRGAWVSGWGVPQVRSNGSAGTDQVRAAMWVHALDGQRLGLLEGWRDLRDGSVSPYASLAPEPAVVEAVARTGLDLLYFDPILRTFSPECPLALVVGEGALDAGDANRWSPSFAQMASQLFDAHVRFDVLPGSTPPERMAEYAVACTLVLPAGRAARLEKVFRFGQPLAELPSNDESLAVYLGRVTAGLPDREPVRPVAGSGAGVFCRSARSTDGSVWVAMVNVKQQAQRVHLVASGDMRMQKAVDYIDGSMVDGISTGIDLGPWQVRLLAMQRPQG